VYDSATSTWKPGTVSAGGGGASYTVNRFLTTGQWQKPANLQFVRIVACTGGNGGNSGSYKYYSDSYTFIAGGLGGWGGGYYETWITADYLPEYANVIIGQAGLGGSASAVPSGSASATGTSAGSVRFGDLLFIPTGPRQLNDDAGNPDDIRYLDDRTDNFDWANPSGGSGGGPLFNQAPNGTFVKGPWDGYFGTSHALNQPTAGASGSSNGTNANAWYYGPRQNYSGLTYTQPYHPGVAFTALKPPLTQTPPNAFPMWSSEWKYKMRNTHSKSGAPWVYYNEFTSPSDQYLNLSTVTETGHPYGYNDALAALGNTPTTAQVAAVQRKFWGDGGGGGGVGVNEYNAAVPRSGAAGAFPGGGGGGGAAGWSNASIQPGSGGNGGAGCIWVYNFIGSSSFSYSTTNVF
jgi:hypothetical protein